MCRGPGESLGEAHLQVEKLHLYGGRTCQEPLSQVTVQLNPNLAEGVENLHIYRKPFNSFKSNSGCLQLSRSLSPNRKLTCQDTQKVQKQNQRGVR